jgi:hypothetical protein
LLPNAQTQLTVIKIGFSFIEFALRSGETRISVKRTSRLQYRLGILKKRKQWL